VKRLRIGFLSVVPSPYQRDLFGALAGREDLELSVFYLERGSPDSPWPEKDLRPWETVLPGFWFPLGGARVHANRLPPAAGFDLFVFNSIMSFTAQAAMRRMPRRAPWVFWGERFTGRGPLHRMLARPLARARAIAAIGSLAAEDYAARFPGCRVANIPYHCDLDPFRAIRRERRGGEPTFLFCGQMIRRKGVDLLLAAFARLGSGRLLLVGREAELPAMLAAVPAGARGRVEYAGFRAPEELPEMFARADVFVLPSRHDGWGVVVNQALGAGLPILCSDAVGAARDLVVPETNGLIFEAGSAPALEAAMRRVLGSPDLLARWGTASREISAGWTPEAGAGRWRGLIAEVLGE
jgi:glycosyltransferase involved in cell wall biosynthesis